MGVCRDVAGAALSSLRCRGRSEGRSERVLTRGTAGWPRPFHDGENLLLTGIVIDSVGPRRLCERMVAREQDVCCSRRRAEHLDWPTGPYCRSPSDPPWQTRMRQLGPCALGGLFDDMGAQVDIAKLPA